MSASGGTAIRWRAQLRSVLWIVAALVLTLRALVPAGFMWAQVDQHLAVVPCMDFAPDILAASAHAHHHHPGDHGAAATSCPFGMASGAVFAATVPALAARQFEIVRARAPLLDQSVPRSIPLRFLAPRGPPSAA